MCCVCATDLQKSASNWRILYPPNPANVKARTAFFTFIKQGYKFSEGAIACACRQTCFKQLKRAANLHATLQATLLHLRRACQVSLNDSSVASHTILY